MRFLLISLLTFSVMCASGQKRLQKFNPVYGSETEINELLAFVSSNIKVELTEDQINGIDGFMVCKFRLDTLGNLHSFTVGHSLRPWIDYAIIGAMNRLPVYGVPSISRQGDKRDVERQLVFSFGSFLKPIEHVGLNEEKIKAGIKNSVDEQHDAIAKKNAKHTFAWNSFTKDNATLKYDAKDALKGNIPVLPGGKDVIKVPITTPTISVTATERPAPIKVQGKE